MADKIPVWYSEDGQKYNTPEEAIGATNRYRQQEKQNQLLANQNWLIQKQTEEMASIEREKLQKQEQLQKEQMEHNKEMRILKRFDEVGISKETYDDFIFKILNNKEIKNLDNEIEQLNTEINDLELCVSDYDNLDLDDNYVEHLGILFKELSKNCYTSLKDAHNYKYDKYISFKNKGKNYAIVSVIFIIVIIISILLINYISLDFMIVISLIGFIIAMIMSVRNYYNAYQLKDYSNSNKQVIDYEKLAEKVKVQRDKIEERIKIINDKKSQIIEPELNGFYNFRINHYNSSIEKLLIDVGFKTLVNSYGLKYKSVNNSNKKKNGTIEDYISYFETY